jgi:hypothetical protein
MYTADDTPLFPFYWTSNPRLIRGAIYERLSEFERVMVAYLESLNQLSPRDLLDAEGANAVLEKYLSKLFFINLFALCMIHLYCFFFILRD